MKISGSQLFWIVFSMNFGMTSLLTLTPTFAEAKQDAWISMIIAGILACGITWITIKLAGLHPAQTLVGVSEKILGKWMGRIILTPYFLMYYTVIAVILRQFADLMYNVLLHSTPLWVPIFSMIILMVYANYSGGIENIGRCSEILGPVILIVLCGIYLLNIEDFDLRKLLPVYYDSGWRSIVKGSLYPASFLGESMMIIMFAPFVSKQRNLWSGMWGVAAASLLMVITTTFVLMTFGAALSAKMWYPFLEMTRYTQVAEFIQNIDLLVVFVWIFSVFIKLSAYLFITSYGTKEWFGAKDWRKFTWVVVAITGGLSFLSPNIDVSSGDYPGKFWLIVIFPVNLIAIPLLLLVIGIVKKKWFEAQQGT